MKIITNTSEETQDEAMKFAKTLKGGEIFGLIGDLGAGKTTFCQGIAKGLGIKQNVNSPTFVIMKQYNIEGNSNISKLIHVDAYRLDSSQGLDAIGLPEFFARDDVVILIEWPQNIKTSLPAKTKYISFDQDKKKRIISYN